MISLFKPRKFYVSYVQDAGMPMTCHTVIEAPDLEYARKHWVKLIANQGFACNPMGELPYEYDELFEVPNWMDDFSILREFGQIP